MSTRSVVITPEQYDRMREENGELVSMLEGAQMLQADGRRCADCWSFYPEREDSDEKLEHCPLCGSEALEEPPPLWPRAAVGFFASAYVVVAAPGFDQVLIVEDGESVLQAIHRSVLEGR